MAKKTNTELVADITVKQAQRELNDLRIRQAQELAEAQRRLNLAKEQQLMERAERTGNDYGDRIQKLKAQTEKAEMRAVTVSRKKGEANAKLMSQIMKINKRLPEDWQAEVKASHGTEGTTEKMAVHTHGHGLELNRYRADLRELIYDNYFEAEELLACTPDEMYRKYGNRLNDFIDERYNKTDYTLEPATTTAPPQEILDKQQEVREKLSYYVDWAMDTGENITQSEGGDELGELIIAFEDIGSPEVVYVQRHGYWYGIRMTYSSQESPDFEWLDEHGQNHIHKTLTRHFSQEEMQFMLDHATKNADGSFTVTVLPESTIIDADAFIA